MPNATLLASSQHAAACSADVFDVRLGGARQTVCGGFSARSFSTFAPQLAGRFLLPGIDGPPRDMTAGRVSPDEELAEDHET